jgi:hypothetical protein
MIKLSNKIISSIVGAVIAGGAITATAATVQPKSAVSAPVSSAVISSAVVSSATPVSSAAPVSSKEAVSNVADGVKQIQKATDDGVSAVNKAATDAVGEVNKAATDAVGEVNKAKTVTPKAPDIRYPVIDINNGCRLVDPDDTANYQKCKDALSAYGNDAGTCNPDDSKACQAAIAAYKAKASTQAPTK